MWVKLLDPNGITLVGFVDVPVITTIPDAVRYNHGVFILQEGKSWKNNSIPEYREGILVTVYELES